MKRFLILLLLLLLTGCDSLRSVNLSTVLPPELRPAGLATPTAVRTATVHAPTPVPVVNALPSVTPVPALVLWVPPQFSPESGTLAGNLLRKRLEDFSSANGGVRVQVRVKAPGGPGGLLDSLNAASAAAPLALPSVVALNRADLEVAALKGLVVSLDGASKELDEADWYTYARQLSKVQGATFALPFAGDALLLAYRPAKLNMNTPPADWPTVLRMNQPLGFPAGDNQALFALSLYQSIGGAVEDAQRRPTLQPDKLSQVLQVFADGEQRGIFPYWLSQYETSGQVWQAYRDGRINVLITWASDFLGSLPPDAAAVPLPRMTDSAASLATGWGWAVADASPERRSLSVKLAEYLAQGDFMAGWSEAAGVLPTRPSALAGWTSQDLKTLLSQVAISAQARPSVDQLASIGPVLKDATLKVLKRENDPTQAAKAASEKLAVPEAK